MAWRKNVRYGQSNPHAIKKMIFLRGGGLVEPGRPERLSAY